nr:hypothetical protein [Candidatus Woesearchaeota archaeon]
MKVINEQVEGLVKELSGEESIKVFRLLKNRKNVSEFKLAEKLDITVNAVRNLLYKMNEYNLVTSIRKKDKKKGWYIYYWTFNVKRAKDLLVDTNKRKLTDLKHKLDKQQSTSYFVCSNECIRLTLEETMENNFKCTECGSLMLEEAQVSDTNIINEEITNLEQQLGKQAK